MANTRRNHHNREIINLKRRLLQIDELSLLDLLPSKVLDKITEQTPRIRKVIYTPLVTLGLFIRQVLSDDGSCKNIIAAFRTERLLAEKDPVSVNTGPYCKARYRLPIAPLQELVRESGKAIENEETLESSWHGWRVKIVDGTTALLQDTPENQEAYPQPDSQKQGIGFPIVRMVALISLSKAAILDYAISTYKGKGTGELSLFARLLGGLERGDLLLGDRYYASYGLLASLVNKGVAAVMKQHANRRPDFRTGQRLGPRDHIICWNKPKIKPVWMSEENFSALPDKLELREFRVGGVVYVTTLLDAKTYPKNALAKLYQERWHIELDFRSIKTSMEMDMLRCLTPEMAEKEIAVNLLAYNIIRAQIVKSSKLHNKVPRQLSFKAAVQLFLNAVLQWGSATDQRLKILIKDLLLATSSTAVGLIKKKSQPRVLKRRPKPYPLMMKPRAILCEKLARKNKNTVEIQCLA